MPLRHRSQEVILLNAALRRYLYLAAQYLSLHSQGYWRAARIAFATLRLHIFGRRFGPITTIISSLKVNCMRYPSKL